MSNSTKELNLKFLSNYNVCVCFFFPGHTVQHVWTKFPNQGLNP